MRAGPVRAIANRILTLDEVWGRAGAGLEAAIRDQATVAGLLATVSGFLRARRPPPDGSRAFVVRVVEAIGAESLARLAAGLGYFDHAHLTSDLGRALGRPPALHARGAT